MNAIIKATRAVNRIYLIVAGVALVLMAVHVSLDAAFKYLLNLPIPATLETVAFYYMPAVIALPLAFVEMKNQHVSVEMLHNLLPRGVQRVILVLDGFLTLLFLALVTALAGREAYRKYEIGEYMFGEYPIVIWPGRVFFFLGFLFFSVVVLMKTITLIGTMKDRFYDAANVQSEAR